MGADSLTGTGSRATRLGPATTSLPPRRAGGRGVSPWDTGGQEALARGGGFCLDPQAEQRTGLGSCSELGGSWLCFMVL